VKTHHLALLCSLLGLATFCPASRAQLPSPQDIPTEVQIYTSNNEGIQTNFEVVPTSGGYGPLHELLQDGYAPSMVVYYRSQANPNDQGEACTVVLPQSGAGSCTWHISGTNAYYIWVTFPGIFDSDAGQYWYAPSTSDTVLAVP